MSYTKTIITKKLGENADKFDINSMAKDSTIDNFKDEYGFVPKSENEKIYSSRMASQMYRDEYNKARQQTIQKEKPIPKSKKEIDIINVQGEGAYRYKKGFHGQLADMHNMTDVRELKRLAREKGIASKKVAELQEKRKALTQKTRTDRLAKKEMRVKEYQNRLARLKKADRQQAKMQRAISRALRSKSRATEMSQGEVRQMYAQNYRRQNDGNIMHTPNLFTASDKRETTFKTNGNILSTPNMLLKPSSKEHKISWF